MIRSLTGAVALLLCATPCLAATLTGQVINGTTGEPGHADRIEIFDVTSPTTSRPCRSGPRSNGSATRHVPEAVPRAVRSKIRARIFT